MRGKLLRGLKVRGEYAKYVGRIPRRSATEPVKLWHLLIRGSNQVRFYGTLGTGEVVFLIMNLFIFYSFGLMKLSRAFLVAALFPYFFCANFWLPLSTITLVSHRDPRICFFVTFFFFDTLGIQTCYLPTIHPERSEERKEYSE